jgi:hypothetical protein
MENTYSELLERISTELNDHINELEVRIKEYGSFNLVANSIFKNDVRPSSYYHDYVPGTQPTVPEYMSLIVLKFPFSIGFGEVLHANNLAKDFFEINELVNKIISKYTFIHYSKYNKTDDDLHKHDLSNIAKLFSANELLVRNPTFENFHWDLLEELYENFDELFKSRLGFDTNDAIRICITIADFIKEKLENSLKDYKSHVDEMYNEIIKYKYKNKRPKNFYPPEYLERFKQMTDKDIRSEFAQSMYAYELGILGHRLSFSANDISDMEQIEIDVVQKFLDHLSINFGAINPDFKSPEIMHPLKDTPILHHEGRYLCSSTSLLDYSLDRWFAKTLLKNNKEKYDKVRHDYLLSKGMTLISETLKANEIYTNLHYPEGEMDGLIFCDSNIYFIEAKSHLISDRAKKGYIDRIENHIEQIITSSYKQAIRTYKYLFGKKDVQFKDKKGRKILIDGSKHQNAYFISLTLEDLRAISCNLKVNNSIYLFEKDAFPWIVSLYDLRAVCEHMEGPSYFIQYLHRRKEFFKYDKLMVQDEMDILAYYLKRNLRFEDWLEKNNNSSIILLDSFLDDFNDYYHFIQGNSKRFYPKMVHYSISPIKNLVKALEESNLLYGKDAGAQILELGSKTKEELIKYIKKIKKQFAKDGYNHDFRIGGNDVNNHTWMLSYWVGPNTQEFVSWFENWIIKKFKEEPTDRFIAILDSGKNNYEITKIINLQ